MSTQGGEGVTVVVNGFPVTIRVTEHDRVADLMKRALLKAGVLDVGEPLVDLAYWELLRENGDLITSTTLANERKGRAHLRLSKAGIKDGERLFLSPEPGAGA